MTQLQGLAKQGQKSCSIVCCSNAQQQQLQQQLDAAQRLLKMAALCSDMAQQHVRVCTQQS